MRKLFIVAVVGLLATTGEASAFGKRRGNHGCSQSCGASACASAGSCGASASVQSYGGCGPCAQQQATAYGQQQYPPLIAQAPAAMPAPPAPIQTLRQTAPQTIQQNGQTFFLVTEAEWRQLQQTRGQPTR